MLEKLCTGINYVVTSEIWNENWGINGMIRTSTLWPTKCCLEIRNRSISVCMRNVPLTVRYGKKHDSDLKYIFHLSLVSTTPQSIDVTTSPIHKSMVRETCIKEAYWFWICYIYHNLHWFYYFLYNQSQDDAYSVIYVFIRIISCCVTYIRSLQGVNL